MIDNYATKDSDDPAIRKILEKKARRKARRGGKIKVNTIVCNFIHQSFFYLDRTERLARVFWEIVPALALVGIGTLIFPGCSVVCAIIVALLLTHLLNWILNNNFWNCINSAFPQLSNRGTEKTIDYLNRMKCRLVKSKSITGLMFLGSLSRSEWYDRSDIDARLLRAPGFWNGVCACLIMVRERIIAVFERQPLDAYLADTPKMLNNRRRDEVPIFLIKRDGRLEGGDFPMVEVDALDPRNFNR